MFKSKSTEGKARGEETKKLGIIHRQINTLEDILTNNRIRWYKHILRFHMESQGKCPRVRHR
jgi:hypothetical protein